MLNNGNSDDNNRNEKNENNSQKMHYLKVNNKCKGLMPLAWTMIYLPKSYSIVVKIVSDIKYSLS